LKAEARASAGRRPEAIAFQSRRLRRLYGQESRHRLRDIEQELMTVEDLADFLQVTPSWIYEHKNPKTEIERWIASLNALGA
jgi:hypothetical protein